jgi:hypothetical protein
LLLAGLVLAGCAATPPASAPTPRLAAYLKGSFFGTSPEDGSEVLLRIEPVFVERWALREGIYLFVGLQQDDGPWLHALYRLVPDRDGRAVVESWRFRDSNLNMAEEPVAIERVEALGPEAFRHLEGCDLPFRLQANGSFFGEHTPRGACRNSHRGGDYVWAQKTITPNQMLWWERGFTDAGEVVWGPAEDGILLDRLER